MEIQTLRPTTVTYMKWLNGYHPQFPSAHRVQVLPLPADRMLLVYDVWRTEVATPQTQGAMTHGIVVDHLLRNLTQELFIEAGFFMGAADLTNSAPDPIAAVMVGRFYPDTTFLAEVRFDADSQQLSVLPPMRMGTPETDRWTELESIGVSVQPVTSHCGPGSRGQT